MRRCLLRHLETVGFDGSPRALGFDADGREVLSYIDGEVPDGSAVRLSDARLYSAAALIRRFHDTTAGTALAQRGEVVCHGDHGHHNMVFQGETAVGLIDWDDGVEPGASSVILLTPCGASPPSVKTLCPLPIRLTSCS